MRVLLVLGSLLALPVLEAWLLFRLGERFGVWVVGWLILAAVCGALLIRFEKLVWALRLATSTAAGITPLQEGGVFLRRQRGCAEQRELSRILMVLRLQIPVWGSWSRGVGPDAGLRNCEEDA